MLLLRHWLGRITLVSACVLVLLLTSKRLHEWSIRNSSTSIQSLRRPYAYAYPNLSNGAENNSDEQPQAPAKSPEKPYDPLCASFPNTSNILVVVKTGASESYAKIPTQLMTVLRCAPDFLLFSDMEQSIAGHHIYDSLDTVLLKAKAGNPDFDLYQRQQACPVDQHSCSASSDQGMKGGWELDKYKNLHIAEKTYDLRPNYDWYLFIDADTYVLWNNLVQWLRTLEDPSRKKHYIGSVTLISDFPFAHGGSGYILSQATMRELAVDHHLIANRYDMVAKESCCGDYVIGLALHEALGVSVSGAVSVS